MTLFVIRELQHVISERLVEAPDVDEALSIFWGERGEFTGNATTNDGEVVSSHLLSTNPL